MYITPQKDQTRATFAIVECFVLLIIAIGIIYISFVAEWFIGINYVILAYALVVLDLCLISFIAAVGSYKVWEFLLYLIQIVGGFSGIIDVMIAAFDCLIIINSIQMNRNDPPILALVALLLVAILLMLIQYLMYMNLLKLYANNFQIPRPYYYTPVKQNNEANMQSIQIPMFI